MEYLGIKNQFGLKYSAVLNFLIMFAIQLLYVLQDLLPNYPTMKDLYGAVITSLLVTASFYGLNKIIEKRNTTND